MDIVNLNFFGTLFLVYIIEIFYIKVLVHMHFELFSNSIIIIVYFK